MAPLLQVKDLSVAFRSGDTLSEVVHKVSFDVEMGQTVALVGESGSGKSCLTGRNCWALMTRRCAVCAAMTFR
jgi:ABC-type microcin C transport system duplicated ATPase subunit YejF